MVQQNEVVPAKAGDPETNYETKTNELIACAPHYTEAANGVHTMTPTYLADWTLMWEKLSEFTCDQDCWTYYVKPAQRTCDGRLAYNGLYGRYLEVNNIDNMATMAEARIRATTYTGERHHWNFEKYVKVLVDQHTIFENLTQHGYAGVNPRSKVRHLADGIKTDKLDSVKMAIMASAAL